MEINRRNNVKNTVQIIGFLTVKKTINLVSKY